MQDRKEEGMGCWKYKKRWVSETFISELKDFEVLFVSAFTFFSIFNPLFPISLLSSFLSSPFLPFALCFFASLSRRQNQVKNVTATRSCINLPPWYPKWSASVAVLSNCACQWCSWSGTLRTGDVRCWGECEAPDWLDDGCGLKRCVRGLNGMGEEDAALR